MPHCSEPFSGWICPLSAGFPPGCMLRCDSSMSPVSPSCVVWVGCKKARPSTPQPNVPANTLKSIAPEKHGGSAGIVDDHGMRTGRETASANCAASPSSLHPGLPPPAWLVLRVPAPRIAKARKIHALLYCTVISLSR